jgi:hypothetical protein
MAILALMTLAATVHHLDRAVADQETTTLQSLGAALQQYVTTTRTIPGAATWATNIAATIGISPNDVLYNPHQLAHQQPRVFLMDGNLRLGWGTNGLPYTQSAYLASTSSAYTSNNYPILPVSPRLMIVSSLGKALPGAITTGVLGATEFANLWNCSDNSVPSAGAWSGWTGDPTDVVVQRINLAPLFVHLVMSKYNSATYGFYTIDGSSLTGATNVDGYFLQGSALTLYTASNAANPDSKQILMADTSLVFEQGQWHSGISGSSGGNGAANGGDLVQQFLNAPTNINAQYPTGNLQQVLVVSNMISYMSNYNYWASNGFPNSMRGYLRNLEDNGDKINGLMPTLRGLYQLGPSGNGNYPTNTTACP